MQWLWVRYSLQACGCMLYLGFSSASNMHFISLFLLYCFQILNALFFPQDSFGVHHLSSFWCTSMFCCPALYGLFYLPETGHLEGNRRVCPKISSFLISRVPVLSSVQDRDIHRRKHHALVCFRTTAIGCLSSFVSIRD